MDGGTQVKLIMTYENGKQAVFKPMRSVLHQTGHLGDTAITQSLDITRLN